MFRELEMVKMCMARRKSNEIKNNKKKKWRRDRQWNLKQYASSSSSSSSYYALKSIGRKRNEYIRLTHGHFTRNKTNFYTSQSLMPPNGSISILSSRTATESQSGERSEWREEKKTYFQFSLSLSTVFVNHFRQCKRASFIEYSLRRTYYFMHRNHLIYYAIVPKGALVPWKRHNGGDIAMSKRWQKRQNIGEKYELCIFS